MPVARRRGLSGVNVYRGEYARGVSEVERAAAIAQRIGDVSAAIAERLLTFVKLGEGQQ
jgi:hypothetical protein